MLKCGNKDSITASIECISEKKEVVASMLQYILVNCIDQKQTLVKLLTSGTYIYAYTYEVYYFLAYC